MGARTMRGMIRRRLLSITFLAHKSLALPAFLGIVGLVLSPFLQINILFLYLIAVSRLAALLSVLNLQHGLDSGKLKRAWRFLSAGLFLWFASDLTLLGVSILSTRMAIPGPVELLRLAGYGAILTMLVIFPALPPERSGRTRELLDIVMLSLGGITLSWIILIRPVFTLGFAEPIPAIWTISGGVLNLLVLILLTRLTIILFASGRNGRRYLLLLATWVIFLLLEWTAIYQSLEIWPASGWVIDAGFILVNFGIVVAAVLQPVGSQKGEQIAKHVVYKKLLGRLESVLPLITAYTVIGFTALDAFYAGSVDNLALITSIGLGISLVARQGVITGQTEMRQFAALVNATLDLAFICNADGEIWLSNPALKHELGLPNNMERKYYLAEFIAEEDLPFSNLGSLRQGGWIGELLFRRWNGTFFPAQLSIQPVLDARDGDLILVCTAHDLTKVKLREKELRAALQQIAAARTDLQKLNAGLEKKVALRTHELEETVDDLARLNEDLKALDTLKSEFTALVSHELRAPLTNIQTGIELVLDSYPSISSNASEALGLVHVEAKRLSGLVETILNLSALEAGRLKLEYVPLDVRQLIEPLVKRIPNQEQRERISIDLPEDFRPVLGDGQAISSIFFHLLDNALKYADTGEVQIAAKTSDDLAVFLITDQGPGIPADERKRIFEMYHRLDSSDSRETYGHGLGLASVKRFLAAMDGGIEVCDNVSAGACFRFRLHHAPYDEEEIIAALG
jgi:PAS domain S-box-containing protein